MPMNEWNTPLKSLQPAVWYGLIGLIWFEISDINWNNVFFWGGDNGGTYIVCFSHWIRIIHDLPRLQEPDFFQGGKPSRRVPVDLPLHQSLLVWNHMKPHVWWLNHAWLVGGFNLPLWKMMDFVSWEGWQWMTSHKMKWKREFMFSLLLINIYKPFYNHYITIINH